MTRKIDERWLVPFMEKASRDRGIAIDVGANVGQVSSYLSDMFDGVVAVEPDPRAFKELLANAPENVLCINAAATAFSGVADLFMRPESVQSSLLELHPIGAADRSAAPVVGRAQVSAVTLDDLLLVARQRFGASPLKFIKIDVEGAEGDVMAGATEGVFRRMRWLVEVHDRRVEVGTQFQRLGYDRIELIKHPFPGAHRSHYWVYVESKQNEDA